MQNNKKTTMEINNPQEKETEQTINTINSFKYDVGDKVKYKTMKLDLYRQHFTPTILEGTIYRKFLRAQDGKFIPCYSLLNTSNIIDECDICCKQ